MKPLEPWESDSGWGVLPGVPLTSSTSGGGTAPSGGGSSSGGGTTTTTQDVQAENQTQQAAAQASSLEPPPSNSPITNGMGQVTPAWLMWFIKVQGKLGSGYGTSMADLATLDVMAEDNTQGRRADPMLTFVDVEPTFTLSQVLPLIAEINARAWEPENPGFARDQDVVHKARTESITGDKGFAGKVGFYGTTPIAKPAALTAAAAAAPAGGTGTAAGGWDTAANRDAAITTLNNLRTRVNELEARLQSLGLLT